MLSVAIAIPTYNEANNVETLLVRIAKECAEEGDVAVTIAVLDDSSPDGTAQLVRDLAGRLETDTFRIRVIVKADKAGLGAAYVNGFRILVNEGFDYIMQMDADLSHDPAYLKQFFEQARKGMDLIVASRYIPGGGSPDWSLYRRFLSAGGNIYSRLMLGNKLTDYTGGYNMYSRAVLKSARPETITATGYGFVIELKHRALLASSASAEVPIIFLDRTQGTSKMPAGTLLKNFALVFRLRFASVN
ncbi:polyprenol monophosphomannose synthase [Cryobacterium arcticum]|uniref:Putative glycosyl transferase n=1 Tax=Cryobacterium arcticum TaxID=670052 RepID=A0A1B1BMR7_9MICO|nr:polyprenol monophosphomannose synthase [Cryobacterium arcticum]ANP73909.1 Putative glycosyl transferase [Cryobacterium arcticum]